MSFADVLVKDRARRSKTAKRVITNDGLFECEKIFFNRQSLSKRFRSRWMTENTKGSIVFYVSHLDGLREFLELAQNHPECSVRVRGSGRSRDGLVLQPRQRESGTVVVSLRDVEWTPEELGEWDNVLFTDFDTNKHYVKTLAHVTATKLMSFIRPKGFLMKYHPSVGYHSIGDMVANSVYGSGGFVHDAVSKLLVMTYDGTIKEIADQNDLRFWKASQGLLGIIIAVELQVVQDEGIEFHSNTKSFLKLKQENFDPADGFDVFDLVEHSIEVDNNAVHAHHFFDASIASYLGLTYNFSGDPFTKSSPTYEKRFEQYTEYYEHYNAYFPQSDMDDPAKVNFGDSHNLVMQEHLWLASKHDFADGFYETYTKSTQQSLTIATPSSSLAHVLTVYLEVFGEFVQDNKEDAPEPPSIVRWHILRNHSDTNSSVLNSVPTLQEFKDGFLEAYHIVFPELFEKETVVLVEIGATNNPAFLKAVQDKLHETGLDPRKPVVECDPPNNIIFPSCNPPIPFHTIVLGREYAFGDAVPTFKNTNPVQPFRNESMIDFWLEDFTYKAHEFEMYRFEQDPHNMFYSGSIVQLLDTTNEEARYDPRCFDGQMCVFHEDCFNNCCDTVHNVCYETALPQGNICEQNCQCSEGLICSHQHNRRRCLPQH
ncbi:MAG: FAD-binding protein [Promethearchaeota archaeon]